MTFDPTKAHNPQAALRKLTDAAELARLQREYSSGVRAAADAASRVVHEVRGVMRRTAPAEFNGADLAGIRNRKLAADAALVEVSRTVNYNWAANAGSASVFAGPVSKSAIPDLEKHLGFAVGRMQVLADASTVAYGLLDQAPSANQRFDRLKVVIGMGRKSTRHVERRRPSSASHDQYSQAVMNPKDYADGYQAGAKAARSFVEDRTSQARLKAEELEAPPRADKEAGRVFNSELIKISAALHTAFRDEMLVAKGVVNERSALLHEVNRYVEAQDRQQVVAAALVACEKAWRVPFVNVSSAVVDLYEAMPELPAKLPEDLEGLLEVATAVTTTVYASMWAGGDVLDFSSPRSER